MAYDIISMLLDFTDSHSSAHLNKHLGPLREESTSAWVLENKWYNSLILQMRIQSQKRIQVG